MDASNQTTARQDIRTLDDTDLDAVSGGLEIPIGPITVQINFDSRCWAVWCGTNFVGGGCVK